MKWKVSTLDELSPTELTNIYLQRVKVFVVEQNCPYQEVDEDDYHALHLQLLNDEGKLCAYSRIYLTQDENVTFGRVLVPKEFRHQGYVKNLLSKTLEIIQEKFPDKEVEIEAQEYLKNFYRSFGFREVSDVFLLDGIPHIRMKLNSNI